MTQLSGKTVLITGAASGIGRLMAIHLARRGARLILWDINTVGLDDVRRTVTSEGGSVLETTLVDLAREETVPYPTHMVVNQFGAPDIIINNAGIVVAGPFDEERLSKISLMWNVNVYAPMTIVRHFLPHMIRRQSGHIVTIASASALSGVPHLVAYGASKAAIAHFAESLRTELRIRAPRIVSTVVYPYYIGTGMFNGAKTRFPSILPILEPEYVAIKIVRAIERNRERLVIPRFVYTALLVKLLPSRAQDWIAKLFGITSSMDNFRGRHK